jgi:hypothetical protein
MVKKSAAIAMSPMSHDGKVTRRSLRCENCGLIRLIRILPEESLREREDGKDGKDANFHI